MKKISAIVVLGALFMSNPTMALFTEAKPYKDTGIGVEIMNKNPKSIFVAVKTGDDVYTTLGHREFEIPGEKGSLFSTKRTTWSVKTDINKPTKIAVWYKDPGKITVKETGITGVFKTKDLEPEKFIPTPNAVYTVPAGKTAYLTYDKEGKLRPQTGQWKGKLGITESGLSTEQNVKPEEISEKKLVAENQSYAKA